jgi:uncharacterized protein
MMLPTLVVAPSDKGGRGVFTTQKLPAHKVIEHSPVLVLSAVERIEAEKTKLYNYFFEWGKMKKNVALGLGYISLYNHAYKANCRYEMDYDNDTIQIITTRVIAQGEELCINYNGDGNPDEAVWFKLK